tara:strand:- start:6781 stop:8046 length:1266 start_codon:yes stop_codon:yes gene_type:complete
MATQQQFNGTGSQTDFVISEFEFLQPGDVNVKIGTDVQESPSDYSIDGTTIKFTSAPASGENNITAERDTNIATKAHTYEPGSSITAKSLNDNQNQALFKLEENAKNAVTTTTLAGNKSTITVSSDNVTWSINDNVIDNQHLKDNAVDTAEIKQNAVTANELADNAVDTNAIVNLNVTTGKIANDAIDGTKIADDAINSEHIAADSIDAEHYAPGSVDNTALATDAVTNVKVADDAIGVAELSATGTASSSTFLRGDNSWAVPSLFSGMALLEDEKSEGTGGGAVSSGTENTWTTRDLNQERFDTGNFVTLSSNKFTLLAGTYLIKWNAPAYRVDKHKSRLYDEDNETAIKNGTAEFTNDGATYASNRSFGMHYLTIGSSTKYSIQHYFENESTSNDYEKGMDLNSDGVEIYTQVEIYKFN